MQEIYHHRGESLLPDKSNRKDQEEKCSSTTESDNDSYREWKRKGKRMKEKERKHKHRRRKTHDSD